MCDETSMNTILKTFDLMPADPMMIVVCAVLFVVFSKALSKTLFAPYLDLIEKRERETVGQESLASDKLKRVAQISELLEKKIVEVRIDSVKKKNEELKKARDRAAQISEKAEASAQEQLRNARWEVAQNMDRYKEETLRDADQMARVVVDRLKSPDGFKMSVVN